VEKTVLVGLMSIIFAQVLPNADVNNFQLFSGTAVIVVANSFISHWLALRGTQWKNTFIEFIAMGAINLGIAILFDLVTRNGSEGIRLRDLLFLILILTLVVTLYDRYRPIYDRRFNATPDGPATDPAQVGVA
jgi:ABC-type multidrug transport system permease subunit